MDAGLISLLKAAEAAAGEIGIAITTGTVIATGTTIEVGKIRSCHAHRMICTGTIARLIPAAVECNS